MADSKQHLNDHLGRFDFWKAVVMIMEGLAVEFASNEPDKAYLENAMATVEKALSEMSEHGTWNNYTFKMDNGVRIRFDVSIKLLEPEEVG